jgi:hypothetical protein
MVKGYTLIVFENWVENSPIQKIEEAGEKRSVLSITFMGSTLRIQEMKLAWTLRDQEQWRVDVLIPILGDGNCRFEWKGN